MSNVGSNVYMDIQPSNIVSTGKVSYRDGNPIIQFIIGENDLHLIGSSVRFCGNIQVFRDANETIQVEGDANKLCLDPKLGIYSVIDTLTISSQVHKSTIERINFYNRFMSSYLPTLSSQQEALGHLNTQTLMAPNVELQRTQVVNNTNGSGGIANYLGSSFCVPLNCGIFSGRNPIPLSRSSGVGGIMCEIQLSPDSQVLFSDTSSATGLTDAYYELTQLKLICEAVVVPDSKSVGNTFEYNSIHSYFNSINSTNAILNFQLGLSNVLSVFTNFVRSSYINSFAYDGLATMTLLQADGTVAPIKQVVVTRAGQKFPWQYNLDCNVRSNTGSEIADPQLVKNFMNAISPYYSINRTQVSPTTNNRQDFASGWDPRSAEWMVGVGVAFDVISGQGVNFQNTNFGLSMETGITTDSPNAVFLFAKNKSTLVFTPNGVQVIV